MLSQQIHHDQLKKITPRLPSSAPCNVFSNFTIFLSITSPVIALIILRNTYLHQMSNTYGTIWAPIPRNWNTNSCTRDFLSHHAHVIYDTPPTSSTTFSKKVASGIPRKHCHAPPEASCIWQAQWSHEFSISELIWLLLWNKPRTCAGAPVDG